MVKTKPKSFLPQFEKHTHSAAQPYFLTHSRFLCRLQLADIEAAPPPPICVALHRSPTPLYLSLETLFCELKSCKVWLSHHRLCFFDFFNDLFCLSSLVYNLNFFCSYFSCFFFLNCQVFLEWAKCIFCYKWAMCIWYNINYNYSENGTMTLKMIIICTIMSCNMISTLSFFSLSIL